MKKIVFCSILILLLGVGCNIQKTDYGITNATQQSAVPTTVPSVATTSTTEEIWPKPQNSGFLELNSGAKIKLPDQWVASVFATSSQFTNYTVTTPDSEIRISEINVDAWLRGPDPDEGYVITHENRPAALNVLKNIYEHEGVLPSDKEAFKKQAGEFLGYAKNYRAGLNYFASSDNKFRGITFFETQGQDIGVFLAYDLAIYNPERGTIITAFRTDFGQGITFSSPFKELADANEPFRKIELNAANDKIIQDLDRSAHENFVKLLETKPRKDLSFAGILDSIDAFFREAR